MDNGRLNFKATIDDADFNRKLSSMQKGVNGLNESLNRNLSQQTSLINKNNNAFLEQRKLLNELKQSLSKATDKTEIARYEKSIIDATNALRKMNEEARKVPKTAPVVGGGSSGSLPTPAIMAETSKQTDKATRSFGGLFKTIASSFGIMSAFYTVIGAISGAFRQIVEFDKAMVNMSAIAGQSRKELKDLEVEIRNVAKGSLNTATQVAEMATELIRLGTTPEGVKALLKPVNDLSIATGLAADKTAILVKGTLNAFQEGEGAATRYADVIAASLNLTALDATKFGDAFKYIGATASVAGYSIEETAAMVGVLVDNNVQASSAGRILSSVLGRLAKDGKDLETELTKVRTSQDQMAQASKTFGAEGARLAVILANNKSRLVELTSALQSSGGSLEKLTNSQLKSLSAQFQIMSSAWTEFILSVDSGNGIISKIASAFINLGTGIAMALSPSEQLSESLRNEQIELNMLVGQITDVNTKNLERASLINELKEKYPEYVRMIGEENLSNENLRKSLSDVNEEYIKRIALQEESEKLENAVAVRDAYASSALEKQKDLYKELIDINTEYNLGLEITPTNAYEMADKVQLAARKNISAYQQLKINALQTDYDNFSRNADEATKNVRKVEQAYKDLLKALGVKTPTQIAQENSIYEYNKKLTEAISTAKSLGGKVGKDFSEFDLTGINKYIKKAEQVNELVSKDAENASKKAKTQAENLAKKRIEFLDQISKAERELNNSILGEREHVLAKINDKYDDMLKKAKELKANEEAINRINALREKETAIATYRLDTTALTTSLEQQKKDYEDFENFKKQVGIEKAKEMYSGIIDVSKNYQQVLQDELNAYVNRENTLIPLTDAEKERVASLFKLLQDYSIQKQENERKSLEEILVMTQSFEQKILNLRAEYDAKRRKLTEDSTVTDLEARLAILDKEFQEKARELISGFADEKGFGTAMTQGFIGATKQIITAQIESLRNYLTNAKDLTKSQVDEIEKIIIGLDEKLYSATDSGEGGALRSLNVQIEGLNKSAEKLEARKSFLESLKLPESSVELAEIETKLIAINLQLDTLSGRKAKAISEEFKKVSNIFSSLAGDFETMGGGANNIFKSLSKVAGIASTVSNLFSEMKAFNEAQKSESGASFSQTMSAAGGLMSAVFGITSMITTALDNYEKAQQAAEMRRVESYIKTLEFERELLALETERLRRNAINISDRQKEADSINKEIILKQKQLAELQKIINESAYIYLFSETGGAAGLFNKIFGGLDLQKLYDELKKLREEGKAFTDEQQIQFELLEKYWLGNRSWEDLQKILNSLSKDYTHDPLRPYIEEAIELAKELEEAGYSLEDVQNMMRELATGTTVDELSNKLADVFAKGEDAVYSFAETMEDVLRNAIVTAFKNEYIVKEMDALFKLFGDMGMDGQYTQEELDKIREESQKAAERLQMQWDALYGSLEGFDFGGDFGAGTADGIKRITETQADRLTGILSGMQVDVIASRQILSDSRNLLSSSLDRLVAIDYNTARTYEGVERIENILQNNQAKALGMI